MDLVDPAIEAYLEGLAPPRDALLTRLEAEATEEDIPIVGPQVGALLHLLAAHRAARRVAELGTAIGYSATWMARGMAKDGTLATVEMREAMARRARANLEEAGLADRVTVHVGRALDVFPRLGGDFDLVFNDVDKVGYPAVLPLAKQALRPGGLLVTDNVLWSGRVTDPGDTSEATAAIREYNRRLAEDPDMHTVVLPLRDGVSISLKRR